MGWRSTADLAGEVPIPPGTRSILIEVPNGTVGIKPGAGDTIRYGGGVRRAADSAADLAALESISLQITAVVDSSRPGHLILKAPGLGADAPMGVFGLELGLFVPPGISLEVAVANSGHVTMADRNGPTKVTTARGDLRFEKCSGAIEAHSGRGNVIAFDHTGNVDLEVGVGDMQVFVRQPGDLIRLVTGQGTVQCHVPEPTEFEVDAVASIGRIGNGFGLEATKPSDYSAALRGKKGRGTTRIILRTGSGHLSLSPKRFE